MKTMMRLRNILALLMVVVLAAVAGCGGQTDDQKDPAAGKKVPVVGISQFVAHPALDLDYKGFIDQMKEEGFVDGENIKFDFQNSQGDANMGKTIGDKFAADKVDAVLAITTPSAQAAAQATKGTDIPVVFIAVSDGVGAGLMPAIGEATGTNVTGVYSADPIEQQMDLIGEVVPNMKRLGLMYNAGEANSVSNANRIKQYVESKGWSVVDATVAGSNEVQTAAQSLVGRVDAVFMPQDNTVMSAVQSVIKVCQDNKLPFFTGDTESVKQGAVGTVGNDEYDCGRQGAEIVARILRGEKPGEIVPQEIRKRVLLINKKTADAIGLVIPPAVLERADEIIE